MKFTEVPKGVTLKPASPMIKHGDKEAKVKVKVADDAALGTFGIKIAGEPAKAPRPRTNSRSRSPRSDGDTAERAEKSNHGPAIRPISPSSRPMGPIGRIGRIPELRSFAAAIARWES